MIPNYLTSAERGAYSAGFDRAARAYLKAHGAPSMSAATVGEWTPADARKLRAHSTTWHATHDATRASKCHAGGMSAVRKLHNDIVKRATDYAALDIISADHLATLTRQADTAAARLAELVTLEGTRAPRKPATRKTPARKLAAVPDVVETPAAVETVAPEVDNSPAAVESRRAMFGALGWSTSAPGADAGRVTVTTVGRDGKVRTSRKLTPADLAPAATAPETPAAPETVPAPMPAMSYAARKASRRELAATMRAAGIRPDGLAWQLARAGVDLADLPAILSGESAIPECVSR